MSDLVKKINLEQKFANLVYKDFQAKRFGLTPCCTPDVNEIKFTKWLCDYQDLKEHDDALEGTPDLDITYVDCDAIVPVPEPTPPDDIPVIPIPACQSLDFDGVDEQLFTSGIDTSGYINKGNDHTISVWFKPLYINGTTTFTTLYFFNFYDYGGGPVLPQGFMLFADPNNNKVYYSMWANDPAQYYMTSECTFTFASGQWYNLTMTSDGIDGNNILFYINGTQIPTNVLSNTFSSANTINYGSINNLYRVGTQWFNSATPTRTAWSKFVYHSLRVWNKILTPAEITQEYNSGTLLSPAVEVANLKVQLEPYNSIWDNTLLRYSAPESIAPTTFLSSNMEQIDLVNDCPQ